MLRLARFAFLLAPLVGANVLTQIHEAREEVLSYFVANDGTEDHPAAKYPLNAPASYDPPQSGAHDASVKRLVDEVASDAVPTTAAAQTKTLNLKGAVPAEHQKINNGASSSSSSNEVTSPAYGVTPLDEYCGSDGSYNYYCDRGECCGLYSCCINGAYCFDPITTCITDYCGQDDNYYYYCSTGECCGDNMCCGNSVDDDSTSSSCFAASELVLLNTGEYKTIADVRVGDKVQVMSADASLSFSEVVFVPHATNMKVSGFIELSLTTGNKLTVTPDHLVLSRTSLQNVFELRRAMDIALGEEVMTVTGPSKVTASREVTKHGVYTIVTADTAGMIIVNGVVASSFGTNHMITNAYYHLHRLVYAISGAILGSQAVKINEAIGMIAAGAYSAF